MTVFAAAWPALGQQQIPPAPEKKNWAALVIAIITLVVVAVASFMTPKRGHQD